jgi:hypothetical protein
MNHRALCAWFVDAVADTFHEPVSAHKSFVLLHVLPPLFVDSRGATWWIEVVFWNELVEELRCQVFGSVADVVVCVAFLAFVNFDVVMLVFAVQI